jgi:hypothetical protein
VWCFAQNERPYLTLALSLPLARAGEGIESEERSDEKAKFFPRERPSFRCLTRARQSVRATRNGWIA